MNGRLDGINTRLDGINGHLNDIDTRIKSGFAGINGRLDKIKVEADTRYVII